MKVADLQVQRNAYPVQINQIRPEIQPSRSQIKDVRKTSFTDILTKEIRETQKLKFSAHAIRRLENRGIHLTESELVRLEDGVKKMEDKGANNSLVLVDERAYVVSVKNRVVVTAMDKESTLGNVFTNIDSVAIM